MESITDWLLKEGWTINHNTGVFEKGTIVIDFGTLAGHTPDSFKEFAEKKGWLKIQTRPMENIWTTDLGGYAAGVLFLGLSDRHSYNQKGKCEDLVKEPEDSSYRRRKVKLGTFDLFFGPTTQKWIVSSWFLSDQQEGGNVIYSDNMPTSLIAVGSLVNVKGEVNLG